MSSTKLFRLNVSKCHPPEGSTKLERKPTVASYGIFGWSLWSSESRGTLDPSTRYLAPIEQLATFRSSEREGSKSWSKLLETEPVPQPITIVSANEARVLHLQARNCGKGRGSSDWKATRFLHCSDGHTGIAYFNLKSGNRKQQSKCSGSARYRPYGQDWPCSKKNKKTSEMLSESKLCSWNFLIYWPPQKGIYVPGKIFPL